MVYRYYNITPGGVNVTISEALIRFSVPDTWIRENRIDSNNLSLYRYTSTWTVLQTQWTGTVNGTHTYEAVSPGFSLFAISGKIVELTPVATVTPVQTSTPALSGAPANGTGTATNPLMLAFGHIAAAPVPVGGLPGRLIDAVRAFLVLFSIIPVTSPAADPVPDPVQVPAEPVPTPDPVPAEPAPAPAVDITTMRFGLLVLSDPPGALIDLDGEYTGKTTPATFASLPGGNHSVRVRMDDVEPEERTVLLERDDEILIELAGAAAGSPGPLPNWDRNCYGGVYVDSYPEGADILVDGQKANRKTPCVIYGLKEGLHTIKVQQGKTVFASEKERVRVDRNSITRVMFTSGNADLARSIRFESDEYKKKSFSVNGRYLGYAFPKTVDIRGIGGSYITVRDDGSYLTYRIPATVESNDTVTPVFSDAPCSVLVTSVPAGAAISVDGFLTGSATPYVIANVSAGKHLVSVSKPGYIPVEQEITLTDNPGDACDATVKVALKSYTWGSLAVSSTPSNATIYLFGRDTGEVTPHTFHYLNIGSYPVKVVGESGSKTIEDVLVSPYVIANCHADLPEEPSDKES
ncbi:MAG: PEGA domain-containing protein [Methanoculleus sp.]|nr:PEGA domain-containing protein [Methanoculleus sp.]